MPKYKVTGGHWGEGHQVGDVIELDERAAGVRLSLGELELATVAKPKPAPKKKASPKKAVEPKPEA